MTTVEVVWGTAAAVLATEADPLALLDDGERNRLTGLSHPEVRNRFVAGRVLLRRGLATRLEVEPESLRFALGTRGKPALDPTPRGAPAFNLAHASDVVALALAPARTVGLDIEPVREVDSALRLAGRRFASSETQQLRSLPPRERSRAFLRLWTAKEAVLKALGTGIAGGLASVELEEAEDRRLFLLRLPSGTVRPWTLLETELRPGLLAAIALPGEPWQLEAIEL